MSKEDPESANKNTFFGAHQNTVCPRTIEKNIYLEEVIAGHAWLARHSSWDHHRMSAFEGFSQRILASVSRHFGGGVDVREICCDASGMDNIVKCQVGDDFRLLQKQRQRLTDAASGTTNNNYCGKAVNAVFVSR